MTGLVGLGEPLLVDAPGLGERLGGGVRVSVPLGVTPLANRRVVQPANASVTVKANSAAAFSLTTDSIAIDGLLRLRPFGSFGPPIPKRREEPQ